MMRFTMVTEKATITTVLLFFIVLSLAGCGGISKPTTFFMLTPIQAESAQSRHGTEQVSVLVGPVTIPGHLDRDQIISQEKGPTVLVYDFKHWAEPLNQNLKGVLIANLSSLLGSAAIYDFDRRSSIVTDYQVEVDIHQLHFTVEGTAVVMAFWTIFDNDGTVLRREKTTLQADATGKDINSRVSALNAVISEFSRHLAQAISSQSTRQDES